MSSVKDSNSHFGGVVNKLIYSKVQ